MGIIFYFGCFLGFFTEINGRNQEKTVKLALFTAC